MDASYRVRETRVFSRKTAREKILLPVRVKLGRQNLEKKGWYQGERLGQDCETNCQRGKIQTATKGTKPGALGFDHRPEEYSACRGNEERQRT